MYINLPIEKVKVRDIMKSNRTQYLNRVKEIKERLTEFSNHLFDHPFETLSILHDIKPNKDLNVYKSLFSDFKIYSQYELNVCFTYNLFGCIQYATFKGSPEVLSLKLELFLEWMEKEKEEIKSLMQEYDDYYNGRIGDLPE